MPGSVEASPLPDKPVEPMFMAPPGDREGDASAPNSVLQQLPTILIAPPESKQCPEVICTDPVVNQDGYDDHSRGQSPPNITWLPDKSRTLLLCGGPDDRPDSLGNLLKKQWVVSSARSTTWPTAHNLTS